MLLTGGEPNYFPNSFTGPEDNTKYLEHMDKCPAGQVGRYNTKDDDNFTQVGTFFNKVSHSYLIITLNNLMEEQDMVAAASLFTCSLYVFMHISLWWSKKKVL